MSGRIDQQFKPKTVGAYRIRPHVSDKAQQSTKSYQQNHSKFATSGRMPMRPMANRQSSGQYPSQNTMNGVINGKMQKKVEAIITIASQHKIIGIS